MRKFENIQGFTLIELLIVIAILAVLSVIAMVQFTKYRENSYKIVTKTDLKNSLTALVGFYSEFLNYPTNGSCGPGPMSCDLTDGVHTIPNGIVVSRGVTIEWSVNNGGKCPNGSDKLIVKGKHQQLKDWEATFESCNYKFTGF